MSHAWFLSASSPRHRHHQTCCALAPGHCGEPTPGDDQLRAARAVSAVAALKKRAMYDFAGFADAVHRRVLEHIDEPELEFASGSDRCQWQLGDATVVLSTVPGTTTMATIGTTIAGVEQALAKIRLDDLGAEQAVRVITADLARGRTE